MLGGENVTLGEFYALVGRLTGAKIPTPALPGRRRQGGRRRAEGLGAACAAPRRSSPPTSSRSTSTTGPTARPRRRRSSATARARSPRGSPRPPPGFARAARWRERSNGAQPRRAGAQGRPHGGGADRLLPALPGSPLVGDPRRSARSGFNLFVLPHVGGRKLWRQHEVESGASIGIVLYPLAVLLLILVFWQRLEVAAAAWGILAFGDGMASVAGMTLGRRKLPWNPRKSWIGIARLRPLRHRGRRRAAGLDGAEPGPVLRMGLRLRGRLRHRPPRRRASSRCPRGWTTTSACRWSPASSCSGSCSPRGTGAPSWPIPHLPSALGCSPRSSTRRWPARPTRPARWTSRGSSPASWWASSSTPSCDWRGYLLLLAFFVLGSAATKLGYRKKAAAKLGPGGQRPPRRPPRPRQRRSGHRLRRCSRR